MSDDRFQYWRLCAWSGPVFLIGFLISFGIMGSNLPPVSPALTQADLAAHFMNNANTLRAALVICLVVCTFYLIWCVGIFKVMEHMEGDNHVLSYIQLIGGALTFWVLSMACIFWLAAAFRPERDPAIQQMLYDVGWMTIDTPFFVTSAQMFAIGAVFLSDQREVPLVPKWLCWYGIWVAFTFFSEMIMPFFKTGPFAFNGLFSFWVVFGSFFIWVAALSYYLLAAISRIEIEAGQDRPATAAHVRVASVSPAA